MTDWAPTPEITRSPSPAATAFVVRFDNVKAFLADLEADCAGIEHGLVRATRRIAFNPAPGAKDPQGWMYVTAAFIRRGRLHQLDELVFTIQGDTTMGKAFTAADLVIAQIREYSKRVSLQVRDGVIVPAGDDARREGPAPSFSAYMRDLMDGLTRSVGIPADVVNNDRRSPPVHLEPTPTPAPPPKKTAKKGGKRA